MSFSDWMCVLLVAAWLPTLAWLVPEGPPAPGPARDGGGVYPNSAVRVLERPGPAPFDWETDGGPWLSGPLRAQERR